MFLILTIFGLSVFLRSQTISDIETAVKELEKKSNHVDTPYVRRLLQETFVARRFWIEKEAKGISTVVAKYPQLAVHHLVGLCFAIIM